MLKHRPQPATTASQRQGDENASFYARSKLIGTYSTEQLRPVEQLIFERYRSDLTGRVLDVGCGAGRVTGHLIGTAESVHGIDVSDDMAAHCRRLYPNASFRRCDMRDLSGFGTDAFDVVVASFNVIDAVGHGDRRRTLDQFRTVLAPGGLLVMSSHNLSSASRVVGPAAEVLVQLRAGHLHGTLGGIAHFPRRWRNHRRLRRLEGAGPGYRILNDTAHDYSLLHYYVSPPSQVRQLAVHGFELLECLDLNGRSLDPADDGSDCTELHYVARLRAAGEDRPLAS